MPRCAALVVLCVATGVATAYGEEPEPRPERLALNEAHRPAVLPMLYVSLAGLQAYDAYSTTMGLSLGARELNPLMRGVAGNTTALWTVKTASTAASIWAAERLWRRNRTAAVLAMVAVNSVMATVAARNAATLQRLR
jgi:Domain of unknown function (DUF5658)